MQNTPVREVADHNISSVIKAALNSIQAHMFFLLVDNISKNALHKAGKIKLAVPFTLDNNETTVFSLKISGNSSSILITKPNIESIYSKLPIIRIK